MSEAQKQMVDELVAGLAAKGLAVVPASLVEPAMQLQKAKAKLMKRAKVTPYECAKFQLIDGVTSIKTVKTMVKDGRITANESFTDRSGKLYITTSCINRLNDK